MIADFCFQPDIEQWMESMKDVKAPVTVYVARKAQSFYQYQKRNEKIWELRVGYRELGVVRVPGGHMDFLEHDLVIAGLQEGYLSSHANM